MKRHLSLLVGISLLGVCSVASGAEAGGASGFRGLPVGSCEAKAALHWELAELVGVDADGAYEAVMLDCDSGVRAAAERDRAAIRQDRLDLVKLVIQDVTCGALSEAIDLRVPADSHTLLFVAWDASCWGDTWAPGAQQ